MDKYPGVIRERLAKCETFADCAKSINFWTPEAGRQDLCWMLSDFHLKITHSNSPSNFSHTAIEEFNPFEIEFLDEKFLVSKVNGYTTGDPWVYKSDSLKFERV